MAENYKHLYEQAKKMLVMYQDEIVPGFRKKIEDMEKNMAEVVRCKDCKHAKNPEGVKHTNGFCRCEYFFLDLEEDHFCSYGERK